MGFADFVLGLASVRVRGRGLGKRLGEDHSTRTDTHTHTAQMAPQSTRHQTMITSGALGGGGGAAAADLLVRVRFAFAFESWAFGLSFALVLARLLGHIDAGRLLDDSL